MNSEPQMIDVEKVTVLQPVLDLISPKMARGLGVLPVSLIGPTLRVCVRDRTDYSILEKLERLHPELEVQLLEASHPNALAAAVKEHYPDSVLKGEIDQAAHLFEYIMKRALHRNASDVHICPVESGSLVKMRIDGKLVQDRAVPESIADELVTYTKVLAQLDISQKRIPQDGSIDIPFDEMTVSLRVATVPTIYGEHTTLRVLSQTKESEVLESLDDLGLHPRQYEMLRQTLGIPNGVVIVSGPTGSGKTTTLYAGLRELVKKEVLHIISIEDPVEKPVDGVTQIKVDSRQERVSFGKALRSVLRHDPDVIMIGEIRDSETANTALRSALTGHLVLASLHTNSAPGILNRLVDLGTPRFLVAATLRLVIAQRLLRKPCASCMEWVAADEETKRVCGWENDDPVLIPEVKGCAYCGMTGYSGRTAIYEMLPMTATVRRMMLDESSEDEIYAYLKRTAFDLTLRGDGLKKVREGETTLEELNRTVMDEENAWFRLDEEVEA